MKGLLAIWSVLVCLTGAIFGERVATYDLYGRCAGEMDLSFNLSKPTALMILNDVEGFVRRVITVPENQFSFANTLQDRSTPDGFVDVSAQYLPQTLWDSGDIETGDLNGDGLTDIVFTIYFGDTEDPRPRVWFQNPDYTFTDMTEQSIPPVVDNRLDIDIVDIDSDGDLDLVIPWSEPYNKPLLLMNNGNGVFTINSDLPSFPLYSFSDFAEPIDVNVDGYPDLVFCVFSSDSPFTRVVLWMNDGTGNFYEDTTRLPPPPPFGFWEPKSTDIDNDGLPDLLISALHLIVTDPNGNLILELSGGLVIYHNLGDGYFVDETEDRIPPHPYRSTRTFTSADLDNDGDLDIVDILLQFEAEPDSQVNILENNGSGYFTLNNSGLPDGIYGWFNDLETKDFDGDNLMDLFIIKVLPCTPDHDIYLKNLGNLTFADASYLLPNVLDFSTGIASLDFNYDGALDVVIANTSPEENSFPYPNKLYANELTGISENQAILPETKILLPGVTTLPIRATLQSASPMSMEVLMLTPSGRLVFKERYRFNSAGTHRFEVYPNVHRLPSGPYFIRFLTSIQRFTKKVIVLSN